MLAKGIFSVVFSLLGRVKDQDFSNKATTLIESLLRGQAEALTQTTVPDVERR